jgi:hypothetical protein
MLTTLYLLWCIDPLLNGESVNGSRYLVTAGKHVNNIWAIARQQRITTIENC